MQTWLRPTTRAALVVGAFTLLYVVFFAPALVTGRMLAPGDAANLSAPHFYTPRGLWSPLIFSGFPVMADPQTMSWYPPALVLGLLPGALAFNAFVLSAYVLASCFAYGYAREVTGSRLAAATAGVVYGLSGFLLSHFGHTNIIHSACWMPLLIWALERLRQRTSPGWVVVAGLAVCCSTLAGQPQFAVFTLILGGCYVLALAWHAPAGRWRFLAAAAGGVGLGLGLCGVLLVPMLELTGQSLRAEMDFLDFSAWSLPTRQLPQVLFPYLYGGFWDPLTGERTPVFGGGGGPVEATGYAGLTALALAGCGAVLLRRQGVARFWVGVAAVALLFALGKETPLVWLSYHVPVLNKFRVPSRHFMEFGFAVAVLAALGVAALARSESAARMKAVRRGVLGVALLAAAALVTFAVLGALGAYTRNLPPGMPANLSPWPWQNPAVAVPLAALAVGAASLWAWARRPGRATAGLLLLALVADLGVFGWFSYWHWATERPEDVLAAPECLAAYRDELHRTDQRLLPLAAEGPPETAPPNRSRLWDVPSALGYCPLALKRYCELTGVTYVGFESYRALRPGNAALDVLAVRYVLVPRPMLGTQALRDGRRWRPAGDLGKVAVLENRDALPRAWLVRQVRRLDAAAVLQTMHTSRLPDGAHFDPRQTALVEEPVADAPSAAGETGTAEVASLDNERVVVRTASATPAFLVLSDVYYPGWRVTVNGRPAPLVRADYVLRGVSVPAGDSEVVFEYRPTSFYAGLGITALAGVASAALLAWAAVRAARARPPRSAGVPAEASLAA